MTIYLDILFLENFILNYIILLGTGIISKTKINFLKIGIRWINRESICNSNLSNKVKDIIFYIF